MAPEILNVEPMLVVAGEENRVTVAGSGFAMNCKVQVQGKVALVDYDRLDETCLSLVIRGVGLDADLASVVVTNPDGTSAIAKDCLESWERYAGD